MSDSDTLHVFVNGEPRPMAPGSTVATLVTELGLGAGPVAVERNREVVRRADHASTPLAQGDRLEVVTFFGGG